MHTSFKNYAFMFLHFFYRKITCRNFLYLELGRSTQIYVCACILDQEWATVRHLPHVVLQ